MTTGEPKFPTGPLHPPPDWSPERAILLLGMYLIVLLATGCQTADIDVDSLQVPRTDHPVYTLAPGDKLRITVYEHENLSGNFTVDDAGTISLPLVRRVSVKGMTLPQLEQTVTEQLLNNLIVDPKVSIDLTELRPFCILGQVRNPGCFSYIHGLIVSKAIALAGGYTNRARKNELLVIREDGRKVAGKHDTPVYSGDVIEVLERFF